MTLPKPHRTVNIKLVRGGKSFEIYCTALLALWRLTRRPSFKPFHEASRWLIRVPVRLALQWLARAWLEERSLRLVPRRSAVTGHEFNAFSSDLDLTALYPTEPSDSSLVRCLAFHRCARSFLPFLGELEIHREDEWNDLSALHSQSAALLDTLRSLRKIRWMEDSLLRARTPYHREKAQRALQKIAETFETNLNVSQLPRIRRQISKKLAERLGAMIPASSDERPVSFYCRHLGAAVDSAMDIADNEDRFELPAGTALSLLAVLPPAQDLEPSLADRVSKLRSQSPLHQTCRREVLREELLHMQSVIRTDLERRLAQQSWVDGLTAELQGL